MNPNNDRSPRRAARGGRGRGRSTTPRNAFLTTTNTDETGPVQGSRTLGSYSRYDDNETRGNASSQEESPNRLTTAKRTTPRVSPRRGGQARGARALAGRQTENSQLPRPIQTRGRGRTGQTPRTTQRTGYNRGTGAALPLEDPEDSPPPAPGFLSASLKRSMTQKLGAPQESEPLQKLPTLQGSGHTTYKENKTSMIRRQSSHGANITHPNELPNFNTAVKNDEFFPSRYGIGGKPTTEAEMKQRASLTSTQSRYSTNNRPDNFVRRQGSDNDVEEVELQNVTKHDIVDWDEKKKDEPTLSPIPVVTPIEEKIAKIEEKLSLLATNSKEATNIVTSSSSRSVARRFTHYLRNETRNVNHVSGFDMLEEESNSDPPTVMAAFEENKTETTKKSTNLNFMPSTRKSGFMNSIKYRIQMWKQRRKFRKEKNPLFRSKIVEVEQQFGSAVVSFFIFLRSVFTLNLLLMFLWIPFIVLPAAILQFDYHSVNRTFYIRNVLDGEDAAGMTWMFYGNYGPNISLYPVDVVYFCCILISFYGTFFLVMRRMADTLGNDGAVYSKRYPIISIVLASWDYSIQAQEASRNLSKGIVNSLRDIHAEEKANNEVNQRSKWKKCFIIIKRSFAWIIWVVLLGGGCVGIFYITTTDLSVLYQTMFLFINLTNSLKGKRQRYQVLIAITNTDVLITQSVVAFKGYNVEFDSLLTTYGKTVVFTLINALVPLIIFQLPRFEDYAHGKTQLYISLMRVFFLRLANIVALVISLQLEINKGSFSGCAGTFFGKELYRIVVLDTIIGAITDLLPIAIYHWNRVKVELDLPPTILRVVYRQAIIWLGTPVCPVLPLMGVASMALMFVVNYTKVTITCKPPTKRWSQPRQNNFFIGLLATTLILLIAIMTIVLTRPDLVQINSSGPDSLCGPFQNETISDVIPNFLDSMQATQGVVGTVIEILTSQTVITPVIFIMIAIIYYQKLRITYEGQRKMNLHKELQQERQHSKSLVKKLNTGKKPEKFDQLLLV